MANIELDGPNKKIKVDSGDLTLDIPGDIILDADGGDITFADGGTNLLKITNSSSDVVFQPQVDTKDIVFKQYDGTVVATVEDNATFNVPTGKLAINGTAITSTAAELNILDGVTSTASEINLLDGGTSVGGSITLADADGVIVNDNGTMKTIPASDVKTYVGSFNADAAQVFNESGNDADFRVESDANTHMLFVDGGNNRVTVGLSVAAGSGELNVQSSGSRTMTNSFYSETHANVLDNTALAILNADTTDNNFSSLLFVDSGGFANGGIHCVNIDHDTSGGGELVFTTRNDDSNSDTLTNCGRFNHVGDFMVGSSNNSPSDTKGSYMDYSGELVSHVDTSNAGPVLFQGFSSHGGTQEDKFKVTAVGSVYSRNNDFTSYSDERLKKDIVDANSQWDDVKKIKFKNFKLKSINGTDNAKHLGVIAQDLEKISPNLINESDPGVSDILFSSEFGEVEDDLDRPKIYDNPENLPSGKKIGDPMLDGSGNQLYKKRIKSLTGEKVKAVKYSILYMKAIKALQEAQTRIETLETKVAALEG